MNRHYDGDGAMVYKDACAFGCEGIVSKRRGSPYSAGRSPHWLRLKNPKAPAAKRTAAAEAFHAQLAFGFGFDRMCVLSLAAAFQEIA
jgi:hypothetical protein